MTTLDRILKWAMWGAIALVAVFGIAGLAVAVAAAAYQNGGL